MNQTIVEEYKLKVEPGERERERERERAQWCKFRDSQKFLAEMKRKKEAGKYKM